MGFDAHVVAQRSALKNVVPGDDVKSGNVDVGEVLFNGPAFPVVVVVRVGKPIQKIGSDGLGQAVVDLESREIEQRIVIERKVHWPTRALVFLACSGSACPARGRIPRIR